MDGSTSPPAPAGEVEWGTPAARWMLLATVLGSGMVFLDSTVVNVALPAIREDLDSDFAGLQWIVNGYMVTLAALILLSGSLSDQYGRVRIFMIGVVAFAAASALCALAPSVTWLVIGRVAQGVGGALLTPGSLAILQTGFSSRHRARAIGAWSGLTGAAVAVGPVLGGALVQAGSWRLIFLINLPIAVVVLLIARFKVPESRDQTGARRLDVPGALLGTVALGSITYALIQWGSQGLTTAVWVGIVVGVVTLLAFLVAEARQREPMLPLGVFRSVPFSITNAATVAIYATLGTVSFLLVIYLQVVAGYSPVAAGASSLPLTVVMLLFSSRSGDLSGRIGPRNQLVLGPLLLGVGLVLLSGVSAEAPYLTEVLPGVLFAAVGMTATVAPLTATVLAALPQNRAGLASGVNNALARSAQLVGVAAVPLLAGITGASIEPGGPESLAGLRDHFGTAMLILAALAAAAAVCALALPRGPIKPGPDPARCPDPTVPQLSDRLE